MTEAEYMATRWRWPYVTPKTRCPVCRHRFDRASTILRHAAPREGDITICIGCASILVFTQGLQVRVPRADERPDIEALPVVRKARADILAMRSAEALEDFLPL